MKEYICKEDIRNKLYDEDAITMRGIDIINNYPAADVREVKKGRWINQGADSEICSACGSMFYISALFAVGINDEPDFCPNCGADMKEESWTQILCKKCGGKRFIERDDIVVCDKCGAKMEET